MSDENSGGRNRQNSGLGDSGGGGNLGRGSFRGVFPQMPEHVPLLDESFPAVGAAVGSLVRVRASVGDQVTLAHKIFRAKIASERPLGVAPFVVRSHVEQQVPFQRETLAAFRAYEGALAGVASHVIDEVLLEKRGKISLANGETRGNPRQARETGRFRSLRKKEDTTTHLSREWFRTNVAAVRRFACMLAEMIVKMFFPSESPLAELASVGRFPGVYANVVGQVLLARKRLGAEVASVWRFACMLTHVIGQMFLPRERFGAILALVR